MAVQLNNVYALLVIAILTALSIRVSFKQAQKKQISASEWMKNWISDFSTEMAGALLTALIFGLIVGTVQQIQGVENSKEALMTQFGSRINVVAIQAAEKLSTHGWLNDGSLQGKNLRGANLQNAILDSANLQSVSFALTNLQNVHLNGVNLQNADLAGANLQGALLSYADLQNAFLIETKLQGAHLEGANLTGANLSNAHLTDTFWNQKTILPDGINWTPYTDMTRFTDWNHPNFWRSENPLSPAYQD